MTQPERQPLSDALSEKDLGQIWQRVAETREARVLRRARMRAGGVVLALAAGAAVILALWPRASGPLLEADGTAWSQLDGSQQLHLADDSRIATSPDGALEVLENGPARLSLHLKQGSAHFEVTPGTGRQWRIESAGVSIEVVGTVFDVTRRAESIEVSVARGVVLVRGPSVPDGVRRLVAGERLLAGAALTVAEPPAPARVALVGVAGGGPADAATPHQSPPPPPPPPLARATATPRALEAAEAPSTAPPEPVGDTAAHRLAAADQARRDGRESDAIADLELVVSRWPDSPEGPLAAFTLANIFDARGDVGAAHTWYTRALELKLGEPLATAARKVLDGGLK